MDVLELFSLKGKVAVVTGAAQGLGREIAVTLGQCGASVVLADLSDSEETSKVLRNAGVRHAAMKVDVSNEADVLRMSKEVMKEFKRVDILVNNAGISQLDYLPTEDSPVEVWDRVIAVNLRGTYLCCRSIGKHMIATGEGSIVNICTTAGLTGVPRAPAYCASKAGVILLTKTLALEWARHNIRVNAIAPHYLETDLTQGLRNSEKTFSGLVKQIPMKRFGKTSEVVGTVLLLCSDASSYTTGAVMIVDGGYLAQ